MIIDSFDKSDPIIALKQIYGDKKNIIDKCLIIFSKDIHNYLLTNYECKKIGGIPACNGYIYIYSFNYKNEDIAFYLSALGSTLCSQITIEVNWTIGVKKFILFGSCGSLNNELTYNKYIIPTHAYRDEGMSYHYMEPSDYIEIHNATRVLKIMEELNVPHIVGKTWTTDAMLRETINLYKKRREEGCIAVEMEIAGVEAVSKYYGYDVYCFLEPGDVLLEDNYEYKNLSNANHNLNKLFIALEIALKI